MEVQVLYFASLADRAGTRSESIQVDESADVTALWNEAIRRHPGLKETGFHPKVACDMEFSDWDTPLRDVREVAFLPPVSGG